MWGRKIARPRRLAGDMFACRASVGGEPDQRGGLRRAQGEHLVIQSVLLTLAIFVPIGVAILLIGIGLRGLIDFARVGHKRSDAKAAALVAILFGLGVGWLAWPFLAGFGCFDAGPDCVERSLPLTLVPGVIGGGLIAPGSPPPARVVGARGAAHPTPPRAILRAPA